MSRTPLSRDEKLLLFSAVFFVAVALLSYLFGELNYLGFKKLGRYLRFLLLIPIYLVVRRLLQALLVQRRGADVVPRDRGVGAERGQQRGRPHKSFLKVPGHLVEPDSNLP